MAGSWFTAMFSVRRRAPCCCPCWWATVCRCCSCSSSPSSLHASAFSRRVSVELRELRKPCCGEEADGVLVSHSRRADDGTRGAVGLLRRHRRLCLCSPVQGMYLCFFLAPRVNAVLLFKDDGRRAMEGQRHHDQYAGARCHVWSFLHHELGELCEDRNLSSIFFNSFVVFPLHRCCGLNNRRRPFPSAPWWH